MNWFKRKRKPHVHTGYYWDGYYESCRCGVSAGDRRNPRTGLRYAFFSDWPKEDSDGQG